jgi:hypothetical protein
MNRKVVKVVRYLTRLIPKKKSPRLLELAQMAMVVEKQVAVEAKEQQIRKPISVSSNLNEQIEPIRTASKAADSI